MDHVLIVMTEGLMVTKQQNLFCLTTGFFWSCILALK